MATVGQILIKSKLPADLKHYADNPLDKKSMGNLLVDLSKKSSDVYRDVVTELTRLGYEIATRQGSSVSLDDLLPTAEKKQKMEDLITEVDKIKNSKLSKTEKEDKYEKLYDTATTDINKHILSSGLRDNKTLAKVILSGSRGSIDQYRRTVAGSMLVSGQNGPAYEMPITRSFSEGLTPAQYLLHTFDERSGAVVGKTSVADSGALAKAINRATLSTKIEEHDCGTHNGLPISVDNKDYIGAFLAHPVASYNYNNEVTPVMLADLKNKHIKEIVVRTALTCEASKHFHHTALCALCVGRREKGIPTTGEFIGLTAGMGPAESSTQIVLGSKHGLKKGSQGGFKALDVLFNPPKEFKDHAPIAQNGGSVKVTVAPQGGHYIYLNNDKY